MFPSLLQRQLGMAPGAPELWDARVWGEAGKVAALPQVGNENDFKAQGKHRRACLSLLPCSWEDKTIK